MRFTTGTGFTYDVSSLAISLSLTRGRQSAFEAAISAASWSVTFDDPTGVLDPDNTGSPLNGLLTPGPMAPATFRIDHYVASLNQYFPLATGRLDSLERTFTDGTYSETVCTFVDQTSELTRHILAAGTVLPAELPGARIARLLTMPSRSGFTWATRSMSAPTALDTGQKLLGKLTCDGNTSSWDLAVAAASAEDGLLYFDAAGVLVFHGQARRLVHQAAWTLTDSIFKDATPTGIEYQNDLTFRMSTDNLIVDAGITTVDGVTSIYGPGGPSTVAPGVTVGLTAGAQLDLTETSQLSGWNAGASRAQHLVQSRSVPRRNAPTVTVDPVGYLGQWTVNGAATPYQMGILAGIDDLTLLTRHPASGSLISFNHWIEGVSHQMANDGTWKVTFTTSRADNVPTNGYWRLGVSQLGLNTTLTW
jgi:hypothetical protein